MCDEEAQLWFNVKTIQKQEIILEWNKSNINCFVLSKVPLNNIRIIGNNSSFSQNNGFIKHISLGTFRRIEHYALIEDISVFY